MLQVGNRSRLVELPNSILLFPCLEWLMRLGTSIGPLRDKDLTAISWRVKKLNSVGLELNCKSRSNLPSGAHCARGKPSQVMRVRIDILFGAHTCLYPRDLLRRKKQLRQCWE